MACDIKLAINGKGEYTIGQIDPNNIQPGASKLELIANIFLNNINSQQATQEKIKEINKAISEALFADSAFSYTQQDASKVFVPNYTASEFIDEFGDELDLDVDLDVVPDVLLVDQNLAASKTNLLLQRVVQISNNPLENQRSLYIVSRYELKNLAAHLRALSAIRRLSQLFQKAESDLSDDEKAAKQQYQDYYNVMQSLYQQVQNWFANEKNETRKEKRKESAISHLETYYNNKFTSLTRNDRFGLLYKLSKTISKYQQAQKENSKDVNDYKDSIEQHLDNINQVLNAIVTTIKFLTFFGIDTKNYQEQFKTLIDSHKDLLNFRLNPKDEDEKSLFEQYKNEQFTEIKIGEDQSIIETKEYKNFPQSRAKESIATWEKKGDIPENYKDISKLFESVLTNNEEAEKVFEGNQDLKQEIVDFIQSLARRTAIVNNKNKTVNTLNSKIHNNKAKISDFRQYFKSEKKFGQNLNVDDLSSLKDAIQTLFIEQQYRYKTFWFEGNNIVFRRSYISNLEMAKREEIGDRNIISSTKIASSPILENGQYKQEKGFYLYSYVAKDNKVRYFYSQSKVYTHGNEDYFDSIQDAINDINKKFSTINLSECGSALMLQTQSAQESNFGTYAIKEQHKDSYHQYGEIIESLYINPDKYGLTPTKTFPTDFTVELYYQWVDRSFLREHAQEIKSRLTTPNQMALFYWLFRKNLDFRSDRDYYDLTWPKIVDFFNDISKLDPTYHVVIQSTHKHFNSREFFVRRHQQFNRQINSEKVKKQERVTITIVEWSKIKKAFQDNGIALKLVNKEEMKRLAGQDDIKGFTHNGIIYINTDKATFDTPFHEYTHILLGILYSTNPEQYTYLLERYATVMENNAEWQSKLKTIQTKYQKLYESQGIQVDPRVLLNIAREELFADDYGLYLRLNISEAAGIFHSVSEDVLKCNIFDERVTENTLFKLADNKFKIFGLLSSQIRNAQTRKLYGFMINEKNISSLVDKAYQVDANIFNNLDQENNGFYKLCK